jgi:hypothetical protein
VKGQRKILDDSMYVPDVESGGCKGKKSLDMEQRNEETPVNIFLGHFCYYLQSNCNQEQIAVNA